MHLILSHQNVNNGKFNMMICTLTENQEKQLMVESISQETCQIKMEITFMTKSSIPKFHTHTQYVTTASASLRVDYRNQRI